jgi:hypothetical protein
MIEMHVGKAEVLDCFRCVPDLSQLCGEGMIDVHDEIAEHGIRLRHICQRIGKPGIPEQCAARMHDEITRVCQRPAHPLVHAGAEERNVQDIDFAAVQDIEAKRRLLAGRPSLAAARGN